MVKRSLSKREGLTKEWQTYVAKALEDPSIGLHLAVFSSPFLELLLNGRKTTESRFSKNQIAPYGKVCSGDIVLVKKAAGPIVAVFQVGDAFSICIENRKQLDSLVHRHGLNSGDKKSRSFWQEKRDARYATIIGIQSMISIPPWKVEKRDRASWTILKQSDSTPMPDQLF